MNQIFKIGIFVYLNSVFRAVFIAKIGLFAFGLYRQLQKKKHIHQLRAEMLLLPAELIKTARQLSLTICALIVVHFGEHQW